MQGINVIGFDLDQTLYPKSPAIDTAIQEYIFEKIAEHKSVSIRQAEKLFSDLYLDGKGVSGKQSLIILGIPDAENIVQEALEHADIASRLQRDPHTAELLLELKAHYQLDLITGAGTSDAEKKLAAIGISKNIFNHMITAATANKSDGSAYRLWLSMYPQYKPDEFLYIGDRALDHTTPSPMGIRTILVNIEKQDARLSCLQLQSLAELRDILLFR